MKRISNQDMLRFKYLIATGILSAFPVWAIASYPVDWGKGFQIAASPTAEKIHELHHLLLIIIFAIAALVLFLLLYVVFRFNAKRHPVPSTVVHNTPLEIVWTLIPTLIIAVIAVPSFKLLYFMDKTKEAELTLKITGHQWYWSYEYPDDNIAFDSYMIADKDLKPGMRRLLEVDHQVVVPVGANIRLLTTAADVIHSFAVPSLGVKQDGIPGRLRETWVRINKEGTYYGQCSEICGINHAFMPIVIKAVSKERYKVWLEQAKQKFANADFTQRHFSCLGHTQTISGCG
jgi:cytochrome c oxidase subunit II